MPTVVSLGSVNVDHVVYADEALLADLADRYDWFPSAGETVTVETVPERVRHLDADHLLGGKGANQAVAAARAGTVADPAGTADLTPVDAAFLGRVGADVVEHGSTSTRSAETREDAVEHGSTSPRSQTAHEDADGFDVLAVLAERGVDVSGVEAADGPTGAAYVFVDETAENRIAVVPGANDAVDASYVRRHRPTVCAADVLVLQNEVPVGPVDDLLGRLDARTDRPTVVLDPAPAAGVEPLLAHDCVDLVTPNAVEAATLADELAVFDGTVVQTRGPDDVLVEPGCGDAFSVTPPAVEPVDTTGAGDVFVGYLAAGLARGEGLRSAVERATVAAALSVAEAGVQRATPTLADVRAFGSESE